MAWVPPDSWNVGEGPALHTKLNNIGTSLNWLFSAPACHVTRNVATTISNLVTTAILYNAEFYDSDNLHSTTVDPGRITFTRKGVWYYGSTNVEWQAHTIGLRLVQANVSAGPAESFTHIFPETGNNNPNHDAMAVVRALTLGYSFFITVLHNAGGNLTLNPFPEAWAFWAGGPE